MNNTLKDIRATSVNLDLDVMADTDFAEQVSAASGYDSRPTAEVAGDANGNALMPLSEALDALRVQQSATWRAISEGCEAQLSKWDAKRRDENLGRDQRDAANDRAEGLRQGLLDVAGRIFTEAAQRIHDMTQQEIVSASPEVLKLRQQITGRAKQIPAADEVQFAGQDAVLEAELQRVAAPPTAIVRDNTRRAVETFSRSK